MSRLRVGDLGDSTHIGHEDHGHVKVQCHPGMDWLTAYCGPYPIHGPARLAFKWKENVKRKCGLIFEFWKIRPRGGTVFLWSRHLLLFLFFKWGKPSKNKKPQ